MGGHACTTNATGTWQSSGYPQPTAAEYRKHAKELDKRERQAKAEHKAAKARVKRQAEAAAIVRENLLNIVRSARHSAADRVAAAHELSTLGFI